MIQSVRIEVATEFVLDGTHASPERVEEGIPVLSAQNVTEGRLSYDTGRFTTEAEYRAFAKRLQLRRGDVLLTIVGTIGRAAVVDEVRPLVFQRSVAVLRPRQDVLDSRYFFHATQCGSFQRQLQAGTNQSSQAGIYLGKLKKVAIPLPPLAEQKRIAAILDVAESLREKRRQAIAKLDTLEQAIFVDMFGDPIENSLGYPVKNLIEVVDGRRPITYGILKPGPDVEGGVRYVRVVDMQDGRIDLSSIRQTTSEISQTYRRSLLKEGDLLLSIRGHVGRLASVPAELEGANITQDTARLAIVGAHPVFVRELLRTPAAQRWMSKHVKGVAVKGINLGDVKKMPVLLPPESLQRKFVQLVERYAAIADRQRRAAAKASNLCASLQSRAFVGGL
jgi:type I restriction enzyme S subunit